MRMLHILHGKAQKDKVSIKMIHEIMKEYQKVPARTKAVTAATCRENGQRKRTSKGTAILLGWLKKR